MRSVMFRSSFILLYAIGSQTTVQSQVRVTTGTTATATTKIVMPVVWTTAVEPVPINSSLKEVSINSPTNPLYSKGYSTIVLMRAQAGAQLIWQVVGICVAGQNCSFTGGVHLLDLPATVGLRAALDLTGSVKGTLFFAFRPVGTLAPNQVPASSVVRQATLVNGQSLLLNNGTAALAVANDRLRLLVGFNGAGEWNAPMSRVLVYPSGQVGVLEEIGWQK